MIFNKSKTVINIEDNKFKAVKVELGQNGPKIIDVIETSFKPENLVNVLSQLKKQFKIDSVFVLLPEDKTYLKLLELPFNTVITRDLIFQKAKEVIPENLIDGYFDWKEIEKEGENHRIQILAVSRNYLMPIQLAAQEVKIRLEAFEPASFVLARLTKQEKEPHIIFFQGLKLILAVAFQGKVYSSLTCDQSQVNQKTDKLVSFVKEKWGLIAKKTLGENLDPFIGLALKKDIEGKDEKVLNLKPPPVRVKQV